MWHIGQICHIVLHTFLETIYYNVQQNVYIFCEIVLMMCTVSWLVCMKCLLIVVSSKASLSLSFPLERGMVRKPTNGATRPQFFFYHSQVKCSSPILKRIVSKWHNIIFKGFLNNIATRFLWGTLVPLFGDCHIISVKQSLKLQHLPLPCWHLTIRMQWKCIYQLFCWN